MPRACSVTTPTTVTEPLYLASASPRRSELLRQIGVRFTLVAVSVDERARARETPAALVRRLARTKAEAGVAALAADRHALVLGADTVVALDDRILGKPDDSAAAAQMLESLSGRCHEVHSAVAVAQRGTATEVAASLTRVRFRTLAADTLRRYCASGEALGKAGGYAIQGRAAVFVEHLEGSYSGVVGLPLAETAALLGRRGVGWW